LDGLSQASAALVFPPARLPLSLYLRHQTSALHILEYLVPPMESLLLSDLLLVVHLQATLPGDGVSTSTFQLADCQPELSYYSTMRLLHCHS
jgi:hypothetical protein